MQGLITLISQSFTIQNFLIFKVLILLIFRRSMSLNERKTKNGIKRILKRFPQYKRVDDIDDADLAVIYYDDDINRFQVLILNPINKEQLKNNDNEKTTLFYLRHRNDRNRKQIIVNDVDKKHFMLQG